MGEIWDKTTKGAADWLDKRPAAARASELPTLRRCQAMCPRPDDSFWVCSFDLGHDGPHSWADKPTEFWGGDPDAVRPADSRAESQSELTDPSGSPTSPPQRDSAAQSLEFPTPSGPTRTPLTYYGGKQALSRQIVPLMPAHRSYLEPFAGGAAVLFAKPKAERETLNDLDGTIIRFWRVLRDRPDELAAAVAATPYSRTEWQDSRAETDDDLEAARRLLVEVDQSFSRSRESWSIPCIGEGRGRWQPGSWTNLPPKIVAAAHRLREVALEHRDALDLLPRWDKPDAMIYCDPPYTGPRRTEPGKGYRVEASDLWPRLVDALLELRQARVILSGYPCDEAERLGWRMIPLRMRRTVQSRDGDSLPLAPEVVWLSPNIPSTTLFEEAVA